MRGVGEREMRFRNYPIARESICSRCACVYVLRSPFVLFSCLIKNLTEETIPPSLLLLRLHFSVAISYSVPNQSMSRDKFSPQDRSPSPPLTSVSQDSSSVRPSTQSDDRSLTRTISTPPRDDLTLAASYFSRSASRLLRPPSTSENDRSSQTQSQVVDQRANPLSVISRFSFQTEESTCVAASSDDELLERKRATASI